MSSPCHPANTLPDPLFGVGGALHGQALVAAAANAGAVLENAARDMSLIAPEGEECAIW